MKIKYIAVAGNIFISIYEHSKFGLVIVFSGTDIDIKNKMEIRETENNLYLYGKEYEEIRDMIKDALPVFYETNS